MAYRLALVSQASPRVNESVDFDSALRGALDTARSLTGARYGVMTIRDDAGRMHCFLSSKMSGEEGERLWLTRRVVYLPVPDRHLRTPAAPGPGGARSGPGFTGVTIPLPVGYTARRRRLCSTGARGRGGVYSDRPGDPGDVRRPGGVGHRQRLHPPVGAAGQRQLRTLDVVHLAKHGVHQDQRGLLFSRHIEKTVA